MKEIQVEGKTVPLAVDKALRDLAMRRDQVEVVVLNKGSSGFLGIGARKACVVVRERKWTGARKERRPRASFHREAKHQNHSRQAQSVRHPEISGSGTFSKPVRSGAFAQSTDNRAAPAPKQSAIPEVIGKQQSVPHPQTYQERTVPGHNGAAGASQVVPALGQAQTQPAIPGIIRKPQSFAEGGGQPVMESAKSVVSQILNLSGIRFTELKAEWDSRQSRVCVAFTSEPGSIFAGKDASALEALQFLVTLIVSRKNKTPVAVQVDTQNHWKKLEDELLEKINRAVETVKNTGHPYRLDPMSPAVRRFVHKMLEASTDVETVSEGESKWRKIVIKPRT